MADYVASVREEIARAVADGMPQATSVFFGGGTPSRLPVDDLISILDAIPRTNDAEVTVECNPEDARRERLVAYRAGGVTRMSFGVQSTQRHVLEELGRRHGILAHEDVSVAVHEAGFTTWNMDLIVGARGESLDDVAATLNDITSLPYPPPHISCYVLTPEPATPLGRDPKRHPDEDHEADAYAMVGQMLESAGYLWEEISNWAKPGHECRHNHLYWNHGNYRGFGSGAHSHIDGTRFWNVRTPDRYISLVNQGASPRGGEEEVSPDAQIFEEESLSLRTRRGVPLEAFASIDDIAHLVEVESGRVTLRPEGRLLANQVIVRLRSSNYEGSSGSL